MDGACSTWQGDEVHVQVWWGNLIEKDDYLGIAIDSRIILK